MSSISISPIRFHRPIMAFKADLIQNRTEEEYTLSNKEMLDIRNLEEDQTGITCFDKAIFDDNPKKAIAYINSLMTPAPERIKAYAPDIADIADDQKIKEYDNDAKRRLALHADDKGFYSFERVIEKSYKDVALEFVKMVDSVVDYGDDPAKTRKEFLKLKTKNGDSMFTLAVKHNEPRVAEAIFKMVKDIDASESSEKQVCDTTKQFISDNLSCIRMSNFISHNLIGIIRDFNDFSREKYPELTENCSCNQFIPC